MTVKKSLVYPLIFILLLGQFGCAEIPGIIAGGVAGGLYTGLTGDEEGGQLVAQQVANDVTQSIKEKAELERLLAALPTGWQCEEGDLYWSEDLGCMIYSLPNKDWVMFNGRLWIDPNTNTVAQPLLPAAKNAQQSEEAIAENPAVSAKTPSVKPVARPANATAPADLTDARKAKKSQGLKGVLFQDRTSKKWFLEDHQGNMHKLEGGKFVELKKK